MNCAANKNRNGCAQGHQPCPTPYTCNYASEAHQQAMQRPLYAPLREVPIVITMDDEAADKRKADDAETLLTYLFWVNVVGGIGAVALVVYLVPWPQAITWLSGHFH